MLSERDQQVLLEAEEHLRRDDDRLVRAFEAFARCGTVEQAPDPRDVLDPRDVHELTSTYVERHPAPVQRYSAGVKRYPAPPESRITEFFYRACRVFFMVAFVALFTGFLWVFSAGDSVLRLLSILVMLPVVGLLVVAVMVLDVERRR